MSEDDVEGEEGGVREGEGDAERLSFDADVGEQVDAADCRDESERVAPRARLRLRANAITGRNSIAATVPRGRWSIET